MERTQFTFYESFFRAISRIRKKSDRADAYDAICKYALCGTEPDVEALPDAAAIAFDLIRPTLDSSRKKADRGRVGGLVKKSDRESESKPEAEAKQGGSEKENEKEKEKETEKELEVENECYQTTTTTPPIPPDREAAVLADFLNRVNPTASQHCLDELAGYVKTVGPEVCRRAFDVALDEKKATWSYIRAILADKQARGVRCLADWEAADAGRRAEREDKPGKSRKPRRTMAGEDFQPSQERIRQSERWLDEFLEGQGGIRH